MSFNIISGIFAGAAIVAFTVWLTQCKPQEKIKAQITREDDTFDGILKFPGDKIKLCTTVPDNKNITWEYEDYSDRGVKIEEDETDNSVTVTVDSTTKIMETFDVIVIAKDGVEEVDRIVLPVGSIEQAPIPTTDTSIFTFGTKVEPNDTITGFSEQVIADPTKLWVYSTLDFYEQESVKYIRGDCVFNCETSIPGKKIFDIWKPLEIKFGNLTFLPDTKTGYSGNQLFKDADLNSLIDLDFGTSNWASAGTSSSANETFAGANLSGVINLNIKDATFASNEMKETGRIGTLNGTFERSILSSLVELDLSDMNFSKTRMSSMANSIYTGFRTFAAVEFDELVKLDMSNTAFASENMTSGFNEIYIAEYTFTNSKFVKLKELDLTGTIFAAKNMNTSGAIFAGFLTFFWAEFFELTELNLNETIFASENMSYGGDIYTGSSTFEKTAFYKLNELNISETIFAAPEMTTTGNVSTANNTFCLSTFTMLTKLDLSNTIFYDDNPTKNYERISTAYYTFASCSFPVLTEIDMSNCVFATEQMASAEPDSIFISRFTFTGSSFTNGTFNSIILPVNYDASWGNWYVTFSDHDKDFPITISGYYPRPGWFAEDWWKGATWKPILNYIPITTEYFDLIDKDEDGILDTVVNFSSEVIANPEVLNEFDAWDFSIRDGINEKIINVSENAKFNKICIEQWKLYLMSFKGMNFLTTPDGRSGFELFINYDLSSIVELDLSDTIWAKSGTTYSGYKTFYNSNFSALTKLNLKGAVFAVSGMCLDNKTVATGYNTFSWTNFDVLTKLEITGAVFAVSGMHTGSGSVYTGWSIFSGASFDALESLEMEGAIFAAEEMSNSDIYTGSNTFSTATFKTLKTLDLKGAVFATSGMDTIGGIFTAYQLFYFASFDALTTLNLSGAVFAAEEMSGFEVWTGYNTFTGSNFKTLDSLDLNGAVFAADKMNSENDINTGNCTFNNARFDALTTLNLSGAVFAAEEMSSGGTINTANKMFENANLALLESLDLSAIVVGADEMSSSGNNFCSETFKDATFTNGKFEFIYLPKEFVYGNWYDSFTQHTDFTITIYCSDSAKPSWFGDWWPSNSYQPYPE